MMQAAMTTFLQLMLSREEAVDESRRTGSFRLFGAPKKAIRENEVTRSEHFETAEDDDDSTLTARKSRNFVKHLVAVIERKRLSDADISPTPEPRDRVPAEAYEESFALVKSELKLADPRGAAPMFENKESRKKDTIPRIVGAFLKTPIEIDDTSIYWIPIPGKRLPRRKSFKKLLAKLTGRRSSDELFECPKQQVTFASQTNLADEIPDSGYDDRSDSSRTSSITSFPDSLVCPVAATYRNGIATSSPIRNKNDDYPREWPRDAASQKRFDRDLARESAEVMNLREKRRLQPRRSSCDEIAMATCVGQTRDAAEGPRTTTRIYAKSKRATKSGLGERESGEKHAEVDYQCPRSCVVRVDREDPEYAFDWSPRMEDSADPEERYSLVARRTSQMVPRHAGVPRHPLSRSEPRLWQDRGDPRLACDFVTFKRRPKEEEPIYDVPETRPRSINLEESFAMKLKNLQESFPESSVNPVRDKERPRYATVVPRYVTRPLATRKPPQPSFYQSPVSRLFRKEGAADVSANGSFTIEMYA